MKHLLALTALVLLAACGADGPPVAPSQAPAEPAPGITLSGEARVGVVGGI